MLALEVYGSLQLFVYVCRLPFHLEADVQSTGAGIRCLHCMDVYSYLCTFVDDWFILKQMSSRLVQELDVCTVWMFTVICVCL